MELNPVLVFLAGLAVLLLGAELLLRGAAHLAAMLRISPILIGLTVVSVGTSMPELAVGITAVSEGSGTLAVGNIAGTNIVNILLILGLSAMIKPLPTRALSVKLDVPVMILCAVGLLLMSVDGWLDRLEGALLVLAAIVYTVILVRVSSHESAALQREFRTEYGEAGIDRGWKLLLWNGLLLFAGMAATVQGAQWLVDGAVAIARQQGVSDAFIGLTIVAIGTSAPEFVTMLLATMKNERDVAIGNLIGSSIYNILVILGLTLLASPGGIDVSGEILWIDLPLAAMVALVCLPVFRSDRQVSRKEGAAFVAAYVVYLASLIWLRT